MTLNRKSIIWIALFAATLEAVLSVPLLSFELVRGSSSLLGAGFALILAAGAAFLILRWRKMWRRTLINQVARVVSVPQNPWLFACFLLGTILRVLWVWMYPAPQRSDQAAYFELARSLVVDHHYRVSNGGLAYWPPGYPFFLATWFSLFGVKAWVPLLVNIFLFGGTLLVVWSLARRIGGESAGKVATMLLVPWPTMVMTAGLASKEMLVLPVICFSLLSFAWMGEAHSRTRNFLLVALTGALLGFASLTQPSLLLFPAVLFIYHWLRFCSLWRSMLQIAIVLAVMAVVISPWTLRNHRVLGSWVPVSTNGGDVFYRGNNPMATGGYMPRGEVDLGGLDEVSRGRAGFRLGIQWIRRNPGKFLALALRKQVLFLGDDAQGAFETLKRGLDIRGFRYVFWKAASNFYWWLLWLLILLVLVIHWDGALARSELLAAVMLGILYLYALHSVFESGAKYHEPLMGMIAVLAAQATVPDNVAGQTSLSE